MWTIAVISQKGDAGKTTVAVHLAVAAAAHGKVSLIVDTDPQATASRWGEWREGRDPEVIDCGAPSLLGGKLAKAAELGAELAVIDTPPHADAMARQAARHADLMLVPYRPKAFDLAAIETTADLVRAAGRPAAALFIAGPPRAPDLQRGGGADRVAGAAGSSDQPGGAWRVSPRDRARINRWRTRTREQGRSRSRGSLAVDV